MRHRIPTIRSLITLIARRATGVSEKRLRFAGVGFGTRVCCAGFPDLEKFGEENGARFAPPPAVRRPSRAANKLVASKSRKDKDTSPTRRRAPRTFSRMFMISSSYVGTVGVYSLRPKQKGTAFAMPYVHSSSDSTFYNLNSSTHADFQARNSRRTSPAISA